MGNSCRRDKYGWRVPREGTVARAIYDLALTGISNAQIAERVGRSTTYVGVVICKFRFMADEPYLSPRERWKREGSAEVDRAVGHLKWLAKVAQEKSRGRF